MDRTIVIGDIHGCYSELVDLAYEIGVKRDDRIISVGDLVAKGPGNREVLEFFRHGHNREAILGNYEYLLLQHYQGEAVELEREHLQAISELDKDFDRYMKWVSHLPLYVELGDEIVVHAGVRPGLPLKKQTVEDLTQIRSLEGPPGSRKGTPWFEQYHGKKTVIFGHWVFDVPLIRENAIGIDTGCVYGGRLTAVILPGREIVSVPAREAYAKKKG